MFNRTKQRLERLEAECEWLRSELRRVEMDHLRLLAHLGLKKQLVCEHTVLVKSEGG